MATVEKSLTLYNEVVKDIDKKELSYYHLRSINNFIAHLNEIKDANLREEIQSKICIYLNEVLEQKGSKRMEMSERVDFFNNFVYPIGKVYENYLNFYVRIEVSIFLVWFIIGNIGVYILFGLLLEMNLLLLIFVHSVYIFIIILYYVKSSIRVHKGLVYAFGY